MAKIVKKGERSKLGDFYLERKRKKFITQRRGEERKERESFFL